MAKLHLGYVKYWKMVSGCDYDTQNFRTIIEHYHLAFKDSFYCTQQNGSYKIINNFTQYCNLLLKYWECIPSDTRTVITQFFTKHERSIYPGNG